MDNIEELFSSLNGIAPLSAGYKQSAQTMLTKYTRSNGFVFLKPGKLAKKSWYLISGYVILIGQDGNENPLVMDIITPGSIFTDLPSFYQKLPIKYKYRAVGEAKVLEFEQKNLEELKQYPETTIHIKRLALNDISKNYAKDELLLLPAKDRMIRLFSNYEIAGLPDKYCASFLRITLNKYMELKVMLLKTGEIKVAKKLPQHTDNAYSIQLTYEVKAYILENYTQPGFNDIVKISATFNTTKKTLTRHFKGNLGVTVHQFIQKLRLEKAMQLLSIQKLPVKEVCERIGYADVYYFSRKFKAHFKRAAKDVLKYAL